MFDLPNMANQFLIVISATTAIYHRICVNVVYVSIIVHTVAASKCHPAVM